MDNDKEIEEQNSNSIGNTAKNKAKNMAKGTINALIKKIILSKVFLICMIFLIVIIIIILIAGEAELKSNETFMDVMQTVNICEYVSIAQNENGEYYYELDDSIISKIKEQLKEEGYDLKGYGLNDDLLKKIIEAEVVTELPHIGKEGFQGTIHVKKFGSDGNEVLGIDKEEELTYIAPNEEKSKYETINGVLQYNKDGDFEGKIDEIEEDVFKKAKNMIKSDDVKINIKKEANKITFDVIKFIDPRTFSGFRTGRRSFGTKRIQRYS